MSISKQRILKAMLSASVAGAMLIPSTIAMAANQYEEQTCPDVTLTKYLVLDEDAAIPAVTFSFDVTTIDAVIAATSTTLAVYPGDDDDRTEGMPVITDVSFEDAAFGNDDDVKTALNLQDGQAYAEEDIEVDFSAVKFYEPGVYRYIITETTSDYVGITNDSNATRIIDVYVTDDGNGKLETPSIVSYIGDVDNKPSSSAASIATKSDSFTNTYLTHDLTINVGVDGNQASRDEYFKVTVDITGGMAPGSTLTVDMSNADIVATGANGDLLNSVTTNSETKTAEISIDADGKGSAYFWLQNGQSIDILGLTDGAEYSVTITNEKGDLAADGYSASVSATPDTEGTCGSDTFTDNAAKGGITADTEVSFTLTKEGTIPTGVILAIAPAVAVALIGGVGATSIIIKNKRKNEEE